MFDKRLLQECSLLVQNPCRDLWNLSAHCDRTFGEVPARASCQKWSISDFQRGPLGDGVLLLPIYSVELLHSSFCKNEAVVLSR